MILRLDLPPVVLTVPPVELVETPIVLDVPPMTHAREEDR